MLTTEQVKETIVYYKSMSTHCLIFFWLLLLIFIALHLGDRNTAEREVRLAAQQI